MEQSYLSLQYLLTVKDVLVSSPIENYSRSYCTHDGIGVGIDILLCIKVLVGFSWDGQESARKVILYIDIYCFVCRYSVINLEVQSGSMRENAQSKDETKRSLKKLQGTYTCSLCLLDIILNLHFSTLV